VFHQNTYHTDGKRNDIVAFKSCFPNSNFMGAGTPPGNPAGPDLTVWNAKAAYTALLGEFRKQPKILFVCVTAPPLIAASRPEPLWKVLARKILARPRETVDPQSGRRAREFNNWLKAADGWLKDYPLKNVAVFDLYDILTDEGKSDFLRFPTGGGYDSHPTREGNERAARAFVPVLNRAVRRAGLSE